MGLFTAAALWASLLNTCLAAAASPNDSASLALEQRDLVPDEAPISPEPSPEGSSGVPLPGDGGSPRNSQEDEFDVYLRPSEDRNAEASQADDEAKLQEKEEEELQLVDLDRRVTESPETESNDDHHRVTSSLSEEDAFSLRQSPVEEGEERQQLFGGSADAGDDRRGVEAENNKSARGHNHLKDAFFTEDNMLLLQHDPLVPLLLLPKPPPFRGTASLLMGFLLLFTSIWMSFESDESINVGPANLMARLADFDSQDTALIGSSLATGAAAVAFLIGFYSSLVSIHEQRRWIKRADHGIGLARRLHQNRMQILLDQQVLLDPSLALRHAHAVAYAEGGNTRQWPRVSAADAGESSEE